MIKTKPEFAVRINSLYHAWEKKSVSLHFLVFCIESVVLVLQFITLKLYLVQFLLF